MTFKKIGALMLATGLLASSMTVMATGNTYYQQGTPGPNGGYFESSANGVNYYGDKMPDETTVGNIKFSKGDTWTKTDGSYYVWDGSAWKAEEVKGSSSSSTKSSTTSTKKKSKKSTEEPSGPKPLTQKDIEDIVSQAETAALQSVAAGEGFVDIAEMQRAAAKNMSAGEYFNNAVVKTPGIEEATPVAQGGGIIIDGKTTNVMATISKVDVAFVDSARASVEGTVLNVVDVQFPALSATINFYMPGVAADANIVAVQYVNGAWVEVEVAEIRADHVVLNLKQNGKVAFIAK